MPSKFARLKTGCQLAHSAGSQDSPEAGGALSTPTLHGLTLPIRRQRRCFAPPKVLGQHSAYAAIPGHGFSMIKATLRPWSWEATCITLGLMSHRSR